MNRCHERSIAWMLSVGFSRVAILNTLLSYGHAPYIAELYVARFEFMNKIKIF
ncbi:hypothetical protein vBBceSLY1_00008 [Bacillus phage vB_BceS_LY1]|uniref:Uncharacterized protein n=1 Tax=Bacillus phage vB_BceS_LY1 TaxID=2950459 RepID=A0AAE9S239_9CAUD|nr:hypothetical protein vBBceSLY1_00008 [Bacillus phage vB_BceS_LY1]